MEARRVSKGSIVVAVSADDRTFAERALSQDNLSILWELLADKPSPLALGVDAVLAVCIEFFEERSVLFADTTLMLSILSELGGSCFISI